MSDDFMPHSRDEWRRAIHAWINAQKATNESVAARFGVKLRTMQHWGYQGAIPAYSDTRECVRALTGIDLEPLVKAERKLAKAKYSGRQSTAPRKTAAPEGWPELTREERARATAALVASGGYGPHDLTAYFEAQRKRPRDPVITYSRRIDQGLGGSSLETSTSITLGAR